MHAHVNPRFYITWHIIHTHIVSFEIGPLLARAILRRELWLSYATRSLASRLLATTANAVNAIFSSVGVALCCLIFPSPSICSRSTFTASPGHLSLLIPLFLSLSSLTRACVFQPLLSISFSESSFLRTFCFCSLLLLVSCGTAFRVSHSEDGDGGCRGLFYCLRGSRESAYSKFAITANCCRSAKEGFLLINFVYTADTDPRSNFYSR